MKNFKIFIMGCVLEAPTPPRFYGSSCRQRLRNLRRSRCTRFALAVLRHSMSACGHSVPQNFDSVNSPPCGEFPSLRMTLGGCTARLTTERLGYYVRKPIPFFLTPLAQRRNICYANYLLRKLNAENVSRLRARLGALPQVPATFLKKGRSKTFMREVAVGSFCCSLQNSRNPFTPERIPAVFVWFHACIMRSRRSAMIFFSNLEM